jgi:HK97 family phage major capsid protein
MNHKATVLRQNAIAEEIDKLSAKANLSAEEEVRWGELTTEFDALDAHRKNLERKADIAKIRSVMERPGQPNTEDGWAGGEVRGLPTNTDAWVNGYDRDAFGEPGSVEDVRFDARNPWDVSMVREWGRDRASVTREMTARAKSAIETMPVANDAVRKAATDIIEKFDDSDGKLARLCLATSSPTYMRAWSKMARGAGHELSRNEQEAIAHARQATRAMSLTDSAGGYLVPFQLDPTVIITSAGSLNQIRRVARQVVATGDVWNGVSAGAVTWSFTAELTEAGDNAPTFAQPSINIHKAQGFVPISIEAIEDEANVAAEVARLLAFGRDTLEATKFISGTGTNEPVGIVTALADGSSEIPTSGSNALDSTDLYLLDNALPARYRLNSSWLAHRGFFNKVRSLDTTGGAELWTQLGNGLPGQLIGRPVYEAEAMSYDITVDNANIAVYGDFQNYVIADRIGMTVEFIPHLLGSNRRPNGSRGWYAYYRVGADSVNDDAFRLLSVLA